LGFLKEALLIQSTKRNSNQAWKKHRKLEKCLNSFGKNKVLGGQFCCLNCQSTCHKSTTSMDSPQELCIDRQKRLQWRTWTFLSYDG
jgi:hypothetical protein